jgi:hypothetical protein
MTYFHDLAKGLKGDEALKLTPWAASLQRDDGIAITSTIRIPTVRHWAL